MPRAWATYDIHAAVVLRSSNATTVPSSLVNLTELVIVNQDLPSMTSGGGK